MRILCGTFKIGKREEGTGNREQGLGVKIEKSDPNEE